MTLIQIQSGVFSNDDPSVSDKQILYGLGDNGHTYKGSWSDEGVFSWNLKLPDVPGDLV